MKRKLKEAKLNFNRLVKKNQNFLRKNKIEEKFAKNKNNIIYIYIFSFLTMIYLGIIAYIIVNYSFSGWNYTLSSILILINVIISLSIFVNIKDNIENILIDIENAMKNNFTREERKQFLRLKKLKNINNSNSN